MDAHKKWFIFSLVLTCSVVSCIGGLNYLADPYGIFRHDFSYQFIEPNKNFIKTRHIKRNPEKYDCLLFGSSRANNIDVRKVPGAVCYNMNYSEGVPRNHLENLRYILGKGVKIKTVILALDEFSYKIDAREHLSQPLRHPYPPVVKENTFSYYLKYLFSMFKGSIWKEVASGYKNRMGSQGERPLIEYDMFGSGMAFFPVIEKAIEDNPRAHINDVRFDAPYRSRGDNLKEALNDIKDIVRTAKENGIRLIILINPIHKTTYLASDIPQLMDFKKQLGLTHDYYDFSGLNSVTTNNYYYFETSHYRMAVGDMMIGRIFKTGQTRVPDDFGSLVTADNIDVHLSGLKKQLAR